jgi:hypothetical protein
MLHGLRYHVTQRYAVVNSEHMVIFVPVSHGIKDSIYACVMHISTYIYACVYHMSRLNRDTWLSYAWLTQAGVQWAERDLIGVLAGASPTNGSPGLPLPLPYIYTSRLPVRCDGLQQYQRKLSTKKISRFLIDCFRSPYNIF